MSENAVESQGTASEGGLGPSDPLVNLGLLEGGLTVEAALRSAPGDVRGHSGAFENQVTFVCLQEWELHELLILKLLGLLLLLANDDDLHWHLGKVRNDLRGLREEVEWVVGVDLHFLFYIIILT